MPPDAVPALNEPEVASTGQWCGDETGRTAAHPLIGGGELSVMEYDHFVSFSLKEADGGEVIVQYTRDQVWLDDAGVWQLGAAQEPFYVWRSARPSVVRPRLCPAIRRALSTAAAGRPRD